MITINLLPEAYRKPKAHPIQELPRSPLAVLVGGLLVGVWLLLTGVSVFYRAHLATLNAKIQRLAPKKTVIDELKKTVDALQMQHGAYQRLAQNRTQWAKSLSVLAEVVPEGVWLTELSAEPDKGLQLEGAAISREGSEMVRIRRFVQDLKASPAFSAVAREFQIQSIRSVQDGDIELVQFALAGRSSKVPLKKKTR